MDYNQFWKKNTYSEEDVPQNEEQINDSINWEDEFDTEFESDESQQYNALISPDAYSYLDDASDALKEDSILQEQDLEEEPDSCLTEGENLELEENMVDDSEMYSVSSLFDVDDEETKNQGSLLETDGNDSSVELPLREKPSVPLVADIFTHIPTYCAFGTYVRALSDSDVNDMVQFILKTKDSWISDKKDKMFNLPKSEITVAVLNETDDPMTIVKRRQSAGAQMFANEKSKWNVLKLYFDAKEDKLKNAEFEELSKESFSDWEWRIVQEMGFKIWKANQKKF